MKEYGKRELFHIRVNGEGLSYPKFFTALGHSGEIACDIEEWLRHKPPQMSECSEAWGKTISSDATAVAGVLIGRVGNTSVFESLPRHKPNCKLKYIYDTEPCGTCHSSLAYCEGCGWSGCFSDNNADARAHSEAPWIEEG